jgi:putative lipoprotein
MRPLLLAAFACLAVVGCKPEAAPGPDPLALMGQGVDWHVTEIEGRPLPAEVPVTMAMPQEGLIAGNSGCNRFNGRIAILQGAVHLGELAGTRMMCPPPQMQTEEDFHAALGKTRAMALEGETLVLRDSAGTVLIRASR